MSKVVVTISVDEKIKKDFAKYAKSMGTNMTNLLSMFMATAPQSRSLEFISPLEAVEPDEWEIQTIKEYRGAKENGTLEMYDADEVFAELRKEYV